MLRVSKFHTRSIKSYSYKKSGESNESFLTLFVTFYQQTAAEGGVSLHLIQELSVPFFKTCLKFCPSPQMFEKRNHISIFSYESL